MRLSIFISNNIEIILQQWEDFAATLDALSSANKAQLRDHAREMLREMCVDLDTYQSVQQEIDKSQGLALPTSDEAAKSHAFSRMQAGFTVEELIAEYRALRASVLRLWQARVKQGDAFDLQDMLRFNEAIDQSLTVALGHFSGMMRDSQNVFLSILGHDVRNPLGAISMGCQMILQDATLAPRHLRVAANVLRSTERVADIVSDLLDYSTSHLGGGIPVTLAEYDLSAECRALIHEMKLFHQQRSFTIDIDDGMTVIWDRARISQAISNLMANALQHGDGASPIGVSIKRAGNQIELKVRNEGVAIPPGKLRTMFDPAKSFAIKSPSERSASQTANLGLGLYITHEIVLAHAGKIWITSSLAEGSTIKATIPALPIPQARTSTPALWPRAPHLTV